MKSFLKYCEAVKHQLIILAVVVAFRLAVALKFIPPESYFLDLLRSLFDTYGLYAVGISSFLENIFGVGSQWPGSIVILTSMALTSGNPTQAFITFLFIILPSTLAHIGNYFIGRRFLKYKRTSDRSIILFLFLSLWHPHFAATSSVTLGSEKIPFPKFLFLFFPVHLFWNMFWAILLYNIGGGWTSEVSYSNLFYLYMILWIALDTYKFYKKERPNY